VVSPRKSSEPPASSATMMKSMTESIAGAFGGGGGGGAGGEVGDASSGFDYRSLLPNRSNDSSDGAGVTYQSSGDNTMDDDECCGLCGYMPTMTWRERILGCVTCMVAGYLLSLGSFFRIKDLLLGDPFPFVFNATGKKIDCSFCAQGGRTSCPQLRLVSFLLS